MKIFVINMKRDEKKRQQVKNEMAKHNIEFEFFDAIDGSVTEHTGTSNDWHEPIYHVHLTKGEVGCALSHYYVWEKIIKENISSAIILEDDFVVKDPKFLERMKSIPEANYDFIYLGRKKMVGGDEKKCDTITEQELYIPNFSYWLVAYAVSLEGAKKLCKQQFFDNITPVDEYVPYMISNYQNQMLHKIYNSIRQPVKAYTFKDNLIAPKNFAFSVSTTFHSKPVTNYRSDILLISVGTENNDCVKRYRLSCNRYGFNPVILGLDNKWEGGVMANGIGGGHKINFLKKYLEGIGENKLMIFTDSYDVLCNNHVNIMVNTYNSKFKGKIVFGSETSCWPDRNLAVKYPVVNVNNKYLNSGVFMGYTDDIKNILKNSIANNADDQLYYTYRLLESIKNNGKIVLDYNNDLFVCMNGVIDKLKLNKSRNCLESQTNTRPFFIHANGPPSIKREMNYLEGYLVEGWNPIYNYKKISPNKHIPKIMLIFDERHIFDKKVLQNIVKLTYPKVLIDFVYLYKSTSLLADKYIKDENYTSKTFIKKSKNNYDDLIELVDKVQESKVENVFYVNSYCVLNNVNTLIKLLEEDRSAIGPKLSRPGDVFANFWGDVGGDNYYKRSKNYMEILNNKERACWNIAYLWHCILIKKRFFTKEMLTQNANKGDGVDMTFCYNMRLKNYFVHILNTENFGDYIDTDAVGLKSFKTNKDAWEKLYLHPSYLNNRKLNHLKHDIFEVHMFTETFCEEVIEIADSAGEWSKGGDTYYDKRIGNKENHPTQDVHLNKIGLQDMWKFIVDNHIKKLVWNMFHYDTKDINITFVAKYTMDGQRNLRPHHDSSTYSTLICLSKDFEGGGTRFIRQNYLHNPKIVGSMTLHSGKMTHYHEGVAITSGERYILVSFIN